MKDWRFSYAICWPALIRSLFHVAGWSSSRGRWQVHAEPGTKDRQHLCKDKSEYQSCNRNCEWRIWTDQTKSPSPPDQWVITALTKKVWNFAWKLCLNGRSAVSYRELKGFFPQKCELDGKAFICSLNIFWGLLANQTLSKDNRICLI